jgi:hypothetical protein
MHPLGYYAAGLKACDTPDGIQRQLNAAGLSPGAARTCRIDKVISMRTAVDQPATPTFAHRSAQIRKDSFDWMLERYCVR